MKRLTELIVRIADLAEAEGRVLRDVVRHEARDARTYVERLGVGAVLLTASSVFVVAGAALMFGALYMWIRDTVGAPAGAALTGALAVVIGAGLLWTFRRTVGS